ncbi:RDD family protein [Promicromonospora soli]|uniref:RDD domain-containing protein n=1 Tax=Promicromonospora soli TaxID=2035533 RepID=A0A919FMQ1_9MICO|nr:RDD family protein [Promicromonospora soli]GHH69152.1 hypothetical protein GCM10017772_13670 [Promicromonospora soli]
MTGATQPRKSPVPNTAETRPAPLVDRALARAIDFAMLFIVSFVVVSIIVVGDLMQADAGYWGIGQDDPYAGAVTSVLVAAIYWGYFTVLESQTGWTFGKMLLRLEVRGPQGGRPTIQASLKRNAFTALGLLGLIPVVGGLISGVATVLAIVAIAVTIQKDAANRQGWHDRVAGGARVVKVG